MTTVLLVAADRSELAGLDREVGPPSRLPWPVDHAVVFEHRGRRLIVVANGAGPRLAGRAARLALADKTPDAVVSTGFCGGLNPALEAGDIFLATSLRCGEEERPVNAVASRGGSHLGVLLSVDRVVGTVDEKRRLWEAGCDAVEMEAAAVAGEAAAHHVPFFCVRVVTDTAAEGFAVDFNNARLPDGSISRWKIARAALESPLRAIPELLRLKNRCDLAAGRLARFLKDCEFEHE
jgi:adenosylhomocysteine nucleosidase